ncbi:MAG: hypothetical protein M1829_003887 [Trizodia sp. TS-e1964]|nr:MAG: hypothetical protein M1829_003887 [Trizodia sp. TS-e1964]
MNNDGRARMGSVLAVFPQISKTPSAKSVAASNDYSYPDYASGISSLSGRATPSRWATPPTRWKSPAATSDAVQSEATISINPPRSVKKAPARPQTPLAMACIPESSDIPSPPQVLPEIAPVAPPQLAHMRSVSQVRRNSHIPSRSISQTPGVDDSPYIRFALDQLTRDQEVASGNRVSDSTYSVKRIIPDEGLRYLTNPEGVAPEPQPQKSPPTPLPESKTAALQDSDLLIPLSPPVGSLRYPSLTFVPAALRTISLVLLLLFYSSMLAATIAGFVLSRRNGGLLDYIGHEGGRYFLLRFLPQMIGAFAIIWLLVVERAIYRILPFTYMASSHAESRSKALMMPLFPSNLLLPRLHALRDRRYPIGIAIALFWLNMFILPLQAALFQPRYVVRNEAAVGSWRWTVVEPVAITLFILYSILAIAISIVLVFFQGRVTGLKWDPTSIADLLTLLPRSNSLENYQKSETFQHKSQFKTRLRLRSDRIGYWSTAQRPLEIFYAIGEEGAKTHRYSIHHGKLSEKKQSHVFGGQTGINNIFSARMGSSVESLRANLYSPFVRYRSVRWFLQDTYVVAWIVIAMVFLLAFLIAGFVNRTLQRGFSSLLPISQDSNGASPAGFFFAFFPSLLGVGLFLVWQSIDAEFRALQPYASLSSPQGASAEDSLLLSYGASLPIEITVRSFIAGHYKVTWISLISILSITLPIIAGGLFQPIFLADENEVRIVAQAPALFALTAFLVIFALSFMTIWPTRKRYLPHGINSLAESISFLFQSSLLNDTNFREVRSKADLVTRLLSPIRSEDQKPKYAFGVYRGRDGMDHLGIDRLYRRDGSETLVLTGFPGFPGFSF